MDPIEEIRAIRKELIREFPTAKALGDYLRKKFAGANPPPEPPRKGRKNFDEGKNQCTARRTPSKVSGPHVANVNERAIMTIIAGIDEAGLGPVLGPLVVSSAVFDVPAARANTSMWELLVGTVCRSATRRKGLIAVGDSKKLYGGLRAANGLEHLERGVLTMLACGGHWPATLEDLLAHVAPRCPELARDCPWYADLDLPLPHNLDPTSLRLDANSLRTACDRAGLTVLGLHSEPVLEDEFNRLVDITNNKSNLLFDIASRLFMRIWERIPPGETARVFVDHQGGRVHYLEGLQRVFEGCRFKIHEESETVSTYTLGDGRRTMDISFLVQAEDTHLPVALASMLSKYVRELFMTLLNRFWRQHLPDLAPTAGYYADGNRFYKEIQPLMAPMNIPPRRVYRSR